MKLGGARTRYGLVAAVVMVVALLAGIAVAGLPESVPSDVRASGIRPPAVVPSTEPEPPTTSASPPSTTAAPVATSTPGDTDASVPVDTAPENVTPVPRPPSEVRVVVANAAAADGLAGRVAEQVRGLGYTDVIATNAIGRRASSAVFYSPDFSLEAEALAAALGIATVEPQPIEQITVDAVAADLWVVLGGDRLAGG